MAVTLTCPATAETLRIASYHTELGRRGPGLMVRDVMRGKDEQVAAVLDVIASADADVILLLDVDWDLQGLGVDAIRAALSERGVDYPAAVALQPNAGVPSGFDLDGNGRLGEGRDALGYGRFTGAGGMALLSKLPLGDVEDLTSALWSSRGPAAVELLPPGAAEVVPLATVAQWVVPVRAGDTVLSLITMAAGTPVFDGPEDRNGRRNADELALVAELAVSRPNPVVLGRANLDPERGEGDRGAIAALLSHPVLADPVPAGAAGAATVDWGGPGRMRVDYVLPARGLALAGAGVIWPDPADPMAATVDAASRGRLVWVDLTLP